MADHIDENAETLENKSLDQSAIDEAMASMQVDESDDAAAKIESAAHSNGGETFASSQDDGHEDLDAAIAALQADDPADEVVTNVDPSESGEASQDDIDAAISAMQADATAEEEAAEPEPPESGEASQDDIDAALAAMQADATAEEEAAEPEPPESGEASQDDIDAALAAMQADATAEEKVADPEPPESGEASQDDIDAALAAMQADATAEEEAAEPEPPESGEASQDDIDATLTAMQADATAEEAVEAEPLESGEANQEDIDAAVAAAQADATTGEGTDKEESNMAEDAGQEDIDATIAAMQDNGGDDGDTDPVSETEAQDASQEDINATIAELQENGSDDIIAEDGPGAEPEEAEQEDIDAAIAAMQNDSEESAETQRQTDQDSSVSEPEVRSDQVNPAEAPDEANTFSGLEEEDLTGSGPAPDAPAENGSVELKSAAGDDAEFSGLDDDVTNPATVHVKEDSEASETVSAGMAESQSQKSVESLPEVTEHISESKTTQATKGSLRFGKKRIGIAALCLIVLVGSAAYFGRDLVSAYKNKQVPPVVEVPKVEAVPATPVPPPPQPVAVQNPYQKKLKEVARLRADLLSKRDEIDRLRQFYSDGISELEEELQQEATRQGVKKLTQALANNKIKLDLQSIQRRLAYIDELAKPYHWLQQGSEELLFLSRRTEIDLQMDAIAAGIELTKHMRRLNASMQKYQLSPERLAIDISNSRLRPLEEIWQAISTQNKAIAQKAVANGDQAIIEQICSGDTGRIAELTTLTIRASKCLSQLDTSELFLNRLTFLSPVAAKYLSNWGGQWLCLNGFQEITPEVARHLFRWEGNWISLNGLEDFSPQIGELLLSWEGRQLELMGLVFKADQAEKIGLQQLSDWEKAGGKLFVPEVIRAEIEKLK